MHPVRSLSACCARRSLNKAQAEGMGMAKRRIRVYSDYKSPYAYLAKDLVYELERETGVTIDWLPYTLDIPAYLGSAQIDSAGDVIEASRNAQDSLVVSITFPAVWTCRRVRST